MLHGSNQSQKLCIHLVDVLFGYRQIILRIVFPFLHLAHTLYVELEISLKTCDVSHDCDVV